MRTYRFPGGGLARALRHLGALVWTLLSVSRAEAQERRYLFEVGAASGLSVVRGYHRSGWQAGRGRSYRGVAPLNFSLEAEGFVTSPNAKSAEFRSTDRPLRLSLV